MDSLFSLLWNPRSRWLEYALARRRSRFVTRNREEPYPYGEIAERAVLRTELYNIRCSRRSATLFWV